MESFANLFEQHSLQLEMREGEVVDATVVAVDHKYVTVTAGLKSESSIAVSEFKDDLGNVEVKVGDVIYLEWNKAAVVKIGDAQRVIIKQENIVFSQISSIRCGKKVNCRCQ